MRLGSTRLGRANLDRLPPGIRRPAYDRSRVTPGIVHLGLGAFHRAHQAVVIDDCLAAGAASWGIVGASLRSPDTRDALAPQDHLYTVAVRAAEGTQHRVIGALLDSVVARESPARLIERMADPAIRIVSLTVTEKGYCHTPQTGDLDERHPDVVYDLNSFDAPRSAPGLHRCGTGAAASAGCPALHRAELRQPRRQWPHRAADRDAVRSAALEGPRQVDYGYSGLPLDHGRPHRAGDDG
ncbi:hypothetical protein ACVWWK_000111 [Bradyrhizobium sp. LB9.1b]